jgi:glyoxylate reductase
LISAPQLQKMKRSAVLVNRARERVVDRAALCDPLQRGLIAAAARDVTVRESLPRDHPLLALPNLVSTPHGGSAADRAGHKMREMAVQNLLAGLREEPLP